MTDRELAEHDVRELPARLAMTLIDTSQLMGMGTMGVADQTAPITQGMYASDPAPQTTWTVGQVNDAVAAAQQSGAGATAQNLNSPNSVSYANAP